MSEHEADRTEAQVTRVAEILERFFPSPADRRMRLLAAAAIVGDLRRER